MIWVSFLWWLLLLVGNAALWVGMHNRTHALPIRRRIIKGLNVVYYAAAVAGLAFWIWLGYRYHLDFSAVWSEHLLAVLYAPLCAAVAGCAVGGWLARQVLSSPPAVLRSNHTRMLDIAAQLPERPVGHWMVGLMDRLPGNQMFHLAIHDKKLSLPELPEELDGLTIAHLSDLHFSGRVARPYFDAVVDHANQLDCDLVAVTGDIIDKEECLDWIAATLGRLRSRLGAYFVLGNHDQRLPDVKALRRTLQAAGLVDLGGQCRLVEHRGGRVLLAGNECPWFGPPPDVEAFVRETDRAEAFRILLAHTPDTMPWARDNGFRLMLAGHTHGGQIRLPVIGPIVAPSLKGVRYASGVFCEPPTVMQVSRGVSGLDPVRFNCPPELTRVTLSRGE